MKAEDKIYEIYKGINNINGCPAPDCDCSLAIKHIDAIISYLNELEERVRKLEEKAYPVLTKAVSPIDCPMCHGMNMGCSHTWV